MKCIILNSGMGTRLGELTRNNPKSMVHLDESQTIFSRAVSILSNHDIDEFIITTGYLSDVLMEYVEKNFSDLNFTFIHNPVYDKTNYIKSMELIPDFDGDVILLHGDLVFDANVACDVVNSNESCVVVDKNSQIPKDDFKAKVVDGEVKYIGVDYFKSDAVTCQPFYKLKALDWQMWKAKIGEFCRDGELNVYAENALNTITDEITINALDIEGKLCMEVDTVDDLEKVREILG